MFQIELRRHQPPFSKDGDCGRMSFTCTFLRKFDPRECTLFSRVVCRLDGGLIFVGLSGLLCFRSLAAHNTRSTRIPHRLIQIRVLVRHGCGDAQSRLARSPVVICTKCKRPPLCSTRVGMRGRLIVREGASNGAANSSCVRPADPAATLLKSSLLRNHRLYE